MPFPRVITLPSWRRFAPAAPWGRLLLMLRRSVENFVGSVIVYVVVAACASSGALDGTPGEEGGESSGGAPEGDGDAMVSVGGQPGNTGNGGETASSDGGAQSEGGSIMNPVPDAMGAEDGERIVNRFRVTADGLKRSEGYYDTVRDENCSFLLTEDGAERCLPTASYLFVGYFSDAACTVPVVLVTDPNGCPPAYIAEFGQFADGTCSGKAFTRIHETGAQASSIWSNSTGECVEAATQPTWTFFSRGARIVDSAFASGSIQLGD